MIIVPPLFSRPLPPNILCSVVCHGAVRDQQQALVRDSPSEIGTVTRYRGIHERHHRGAADPYAPPVSALFPVTVLCVMSTTPPSAWRPPLWLKFVLLLVKRLRVIRTVPPVEKSPPPRLWVMVVWTRCTVPPLL